MRAAKIAMLGIALAVSACDKGKKVDCDTEIKYDARKIAGEVKVGQYGGSLSTEIEAVRQIDQVVERYMARWMSICKEYNAGVHTREEYAAQTNELRTQMKDLDELLLKLQSAPDAASYQLVIKQMYDAVVPAAERREIALDFTFSAAPPGSETLAPITDGTQLRSGSKLFVAVKPSVTAHVYLYQQSAKGELVRLFPQPAIPIANPIPAGQEVRIPPHPQTFRLNDQDIGIEKVYIVASLDPIPSLESALAKDSVTVAEANCAARGLELDAGTNCEGSRGLELDPGDATVSIKAVSAAGDDRILQVFSFDHTP